MLSKASEKKPNKMWERKKIFWILTVICYIASCVFNIVASKIYTQHGSCPSEFNSVKHNICLDISYSGKYPILLKTGPPAVCQGLYKSQYYFKTTLCSQHWLNALGIINIIGAFIFFCFIKIAVDKK